MNETEVEKWRPSEKMKSEEFILAVNDSDSENGPENFLPNEHKNSKVTLETDRPTPNNKVITHVISDSHSNKNSHGDKTETMWEGYFLGLMPELSAASGYTSRLNPEAVVFIPTPAVRNQMESTTDVNPILTSAQQQSDQPRQPTEPRRSARLRQKRLAETTPAEQQTNQIKSNQISLIQATRPIEHTHTHGHTQET